MRDERERCTLLVGRVEACLASRTISYQRKRSMI